MNKQHLGDSADLGSAHAEMTRPDGRQFSVLDALTIREQCLAALSKETQANLAQCQKLGLAPEEVRLPPAPPPPFGPHLFNPLQAHSDGAGVALMRLCV